MGWGPGLFPATSTALGGDPHPGACEVTCRVPASLAGSTSGERKGTDGASPRGELSRGSLRGLRGHVTTAGGEGGRTATSGTRR